ncbi:putative DD41D transposase [Trichonephila clavipes]|nr:putative DD41D transposase [Trichonephila clavipes]
MCVCSSNPTRYKREQFWDDLVTGDEKRFVYKYVVRKKAYAYEGETSPSTSKVGMHQKKVMLYCSHTRAIGARPHYPELLSSDKTDVRASSPTLQRLIHCADVKALKTFNVHHTSTRRVFDGTKTPTHDTTNSSLFHDCQVIYSQFGLAIHQNDHQARRRFVEWAQNEIAVVPDFHKRILFSDEAHFWLNGYGNKQNCRLWSEANPQVYVETPLHPEKLTAWCALWAGGIIGPYFFKNDEGHNVTVTGDRYSAMITNFFIPELNNHDVQELWFQQDGATCHTARATIDLLKDTFGNCLISRFEPVNWPPKSCDLTPLDYFL